MKQKTHNKRMEKPQPRFEKESQAKVLILDDSPILSGKRRVSEFNVENGMVTLRITIRNDDGIKPN